MDAALLARIQFAFTISFHYIFPVISIGLAWMIVWFQTAYLKTGDELYSKVARYWIKLFAVTFAVGVATGITMEFQFGTNWAAYSRFVGDIFGAPLAAEAIFAFFLESSFLGILLYGEDRVSKKAYWFSALMIAVGSTLSGFWIVVANSWQQTPAGHIVENGKAVLVDFWAAVFNPSTIPRYLHVIDGALIAGAFFVMGIAAIYLLRGTHTKFAKVSMKAGLIMATLAVFMVGPISHWHAVQVAQTQPAKLAAFEGLWETTDNAPFLLFGIPNVEKERTDFAIEIPGVLSLLVGNSLDTVVTGLKDIPKDERPPIMITFASFHSMIALGGFFMAFCGWGIFLLWRGKLFTSKLFHRVAVLSIPLPIICNIVGWAAAEVGRQPWIVQGLLKTKDAVSASVSAGEIITTIILFGLIYALLFAVWLYTLRFKINNGPEEV
ncbi:MAG: cytochrome ubiquinol oxidase subunit I [Bacteriovoracaceae bacterium]|nr:cytochrome ubiquinol oxidase subunit I [Bacteriovoracaceae bacterium]